jgi:hypothetical protein
VEEETRAPTTPAARVATRPGTSGVSEKRRRIYQVHLLAFLAANIGVLALDLYTSPGIQWGYFLTVPWFLVFLLHSVGLKSRGYSVGEMLIPPRNKPVRAVYTTPLDYELIRARQLRDGIANAVAAARTAGNQLADQALAAADKLVAAVESTVTTAREQKYRQDEQSEKLIPAAQAAIETLDQLHRRLLRLVVLEQQDEELPIQTVEDQAEDLAKLSR